MGVGGISGFHGLLASPASLGLIEEVPEIQGITSEDFARLFGVTTLRPKNSQLNCQKIQSYLPFSLPHWQVGAQQWLDAQTSLMADTQTTADLKANNTGQS